MNRSSRQLEATRQPLRQTLARRAPARHRGGLGRLVAAALLVLCAGGASAQIGDYANVGCTASIENRSSLVDANGDYNIPNVPAVQGQYKVHIVCPQPDGSLLDAWSGYYSLLSAPDIPVPLLPLDVPSPQPTRLQLQEFSGQLTAVGATVQLSTLAILPVGTPLDVTLGSAGTTYVSSNPAVATVSADGLVTATGAGALTVTANNNGLTATLLIQSFAALDSDGDGMPDAWEIANGLNPYDPTDANLDPDGDGLTNLQEYQLGTNPHVADTDGDGLTDGQEVALGTNPLVADTDGDGLTDGQEVALGTNPLLADTDGDGIPDGVEVKIGTNPLVPDVTTSVTGHVTNPDGTPSKGTSVVVLTYFTAVTDSTGAFTILHVPITLGNITASAEEVIQSQVYSGASAATPGVGNGVTDVGTISLGQNAGQVSGTVTTPDHQPAVNVQVTVTGGNDSRATVTDGSGLYAVSGLSSGPIAVSAFDPNTSLRGQAIGTLNASAPLTLNVQLAPYGTVSGYVLNVKGQSVGAGVSVTISGALNSTATTDGLGHYSFSFVPLGSFTLDATDSNGNHGHTTGSVTATAQTISANIQYLGKGTVSGIVSDTGGTPVAGATVVLGNQGLFSQQFTTTTNSVGQFSFSGVFVGTIVLSATSAATNTGGTATTAITSDGQSVTQNITLMPSGSVSGTVYRVDGTTPVAGAAVSLNGSAFATTTASNGTFTISNAPLGGYTVIATDTASADRGEKPVTLTTSGQTVPVTINMVGLGTVNITVEDGGGTPVSGAVVQVNTNSPFYQVQNGVSAGDGTLTFNQVLASSLTVQATNQVLGLSGSTNATLTAGQTLPVVVKLQPAGTIQGTVYQHDGHTPVAGITVEVILSNNQVLSTLTAADGTYSLSNVPSGTLYVAVADSVGNVLAYNNNVVISTQGQVVTANFVIVGRGTVTGKVTNQDGSVASGVSVQVASSLGGTSYGTATDINGNYAIALVPVGAYNVVAQQHTVTTNSYGTAAGALPSDGATSVTNVVLSNSLVPATVELTDANSLQYAVRENGGIFDGSFGVFSGDSATHQGAALLSIRQNGQPTPFIGEEFAPVDLGGREISITQNGLDGLNITRRVYVPIDGYFARYIELLSNPGASDITVDVQLSTNFRPVLQDIKLNGLTYSNTNTPAILSTSSGDNYLNISDPTNPDNWVTLSGAIDQDPFTSDEFAEFPIPTVADVFDGPGAALKPTTATYLTDDTQTFSTLTEIYQTLTVPAGHTIGILHFLSQENLYASGNASATRLVQLPPEALAGISSVDLSSIVNFVIPPGGVSTVAPLPSITNQISGTVYASDGITPLPHAIVHEQSTDPVYARTYVTGADGSGVYSFQGVYGGIAVPTDPFNVLAFEPVAATALTPDCAQFGNYTSYGCAIISPTYLGTFASGVTTAQQDITFGNTGIVTGTISRGPTVLNVAGTVVLSGGPMISVTVPIQSDGTYIFTGVLPGSYNLEAFVSNTLLTGLTTTTVAAGQTTTTNITIIESGNITGTVTRPDNSLAINDIVNLRVPNQAPISVYVDTSGHYAFTDVPIGMFSVDCFDQLTNTAASATVTVTSGNTTTQNLALQSAGGVQGTVSVNDGSSLANIAVTLTSTTTSGTQTFNTTTDANGRFSFTNVMPGNLTVHAVNFENLQGTATGALPLAGQTVTINVSLVAAGSLQGTVFQGDGTTPAAGIQLTLSPAPLTGSATITSASDGTYSYSNVPLGGFTVYATNKTTGDLGQASSQIQAIGQLRTVNITLNGFGNLAVTVHSTDGSVVPGATVNVTTNNTGNKYSGTTDATGVAQFTGIFAGPYSVTARDPVSGYSVQGTGTVGYQANATITLTLQSLGTIQGTIYAPDGVTPQAGAMVQLSGSASRNATTGADGTYQFASIPTGYYFLAVRDASNFVRASTTEFQLQGSGSVLTKNLTFVGVGTVTGTVVDTDGATPLENTSLTLTSQNGSVGGSQNTVTGGDGTYTFSEVPVGKFTVTVNNLPSGEIGYGNGTITADQTSTVVNIQVQGNAINLPVTLTDADGFIYNIYGNGEYYGNGGSGGFVPFGNAQPLTINAGGGAVTFGNGSVAAIQSLSGQQIELSAPTSSITVTRKVYVPATGYFARRLDVLTNPNNSPVTVTVQLGGGGYDRETKNGNPQIVTTSNNNKTVNSSILWLVDDDDPGNVPYPQTEPAVATIIAGPGAPTVLASAANTVNSYVEGYGNNQYVLGVLTNTYTFQPVTIPANSSVSFLSFTAQEATQGTAETAAQRLVQLPPEALVGLSTQDLASVVNFVIPATQTLPAIYAPVGGTLSGRTLAGDSTTPVPNAVVYAQSTDLEYGAGATTTSDSGGAYALPSFGASSYAAEARDPVTGVTSTMVTGSFPANVTSQTQDIPFTNTGILHGIMQPAGATTIYNGNVYASFYCAPNNTYCGQGSMNFDSTGIFNFLTAPAGSANLYVNVYTSALGGYYLQQNGVSIPAGQTTNVTFYLPPTGGIQGVVTNADGTPAAAAAVAIYPAGSGFYESTTTDANGNYAFPNIALDTYTVYATDPITKTQVSKTTTVTQDVTSTVNLAFIGKGTLNVSVLYANGNIGQNSQVILYVANQANYYAAGYTDTNGQVSFSNVPVGAFTIKAYYPGQNFYSTTAGSLTSNNQTLPFPVTLSPVGIINGKVTYSDGVTPAVGAYVGATDASGTFTYSAQTDSAGNYAMSPVPADRTVTLTSYNTTNNTTGKTIEAVASNQQVPGDAQTLTINLRYPGLANVKVTVEKADGTVDTTDQISVYLNSINSPQTQSYSSSTSVNPGTGAVTFNNVVESQFIATAVNYTNYTGYNMGSTVFTVGGADDGTTKQIVIKATPVGTVQGTVYAADGTTPLESNWTIFLTDIDPNTTTSQNSGSQGSTYQFTNVQVGASGFTLTPQFGNTKYTSLAVNGNITSQGQVVTQNFTLPVSAISGTVYLNDGVTPVPFAEVSGSETTNGYSTFYGATADANGNYQIDGPPSGTLIIVAYDENGVTGVVNLTVPSDTSVLSGVNVNIGPVGTVLGTLYDANSNPIPNNEVDLQSSGNNGGFSNSTQTDDDGNFQFTDVPIGNITLSATLPDNSNESNTGVLNNNGDVVTINLGTPPVVNNGSIFGTVYDANQDPDPGATVSATPDATGQTVTATTDDNGMYTISGLPVGSITVSAVLDDGSTNAGTTVGYIADLNTPVEIDIGLQNPGDVSGTIYDGSGNPYPNVSIGMTTTADPDTLYVTSAFGDGTYDFGTTDPGSITIYIYTTNDYNNPTGSATGILPYGGNVVINAYDNVFASQNMNPRFGNVQPGTVLALQRKLQVAGPIHGRSIALQPTGLALLAAPPSKDNNWVPALVFVPPTPPPHPGAAQGVHQ
jgi:hypothetical protein